MSSVSHSPRFSLVVAVALCAGACAHAPTSRNAPSPVAAARTAEVTTPPTLGPPPSLTLPPIVERELPNGLTLLVVEHHELPVADFILLIRTGGEADPGDRGGLASVTADMLDEGTATRNALQIADQEAYLGVDLGTASRWDASEVSLHTTTAQLDSALALFADVALHPAFPDADLERIRKDRLTALIQLKDRGPAIADRAFAAIVFGAAHPYGHPLIGTEGSIGAITRDDVRRFYDAFYRPNNATLIVVGDVRPDDVERRVRALFGGWERQTVPVVTYGNAPTSETTTIDLIDKPGAAQSSFRVGRVGVARSTPDYFAIEVMNTILGGSFTSRLNQNLRETHGYTYGAFSNFAMRRSAGPFIAQAEIVAAKTDSALVELMRELKAIRDTVPGGELEKAKRYLQLQLPGEFESTGDIAEQLVPVSLYDLPLDYYDRYVQRVEQVTQRDVQRVAERYVDPRSMRIVIVGDRKSIEGGLRALDLAPVSVRELDGKLVSP